MMIVAAPHVGFEPNSADAALLTNGCPWKLVQLVAVRGPES